MTHYHLAVILSLSLMACGPTFSAAEVEEQAGAAGADVGAGTGGTDGTAAAAGLGGAGSGGTAAGSGGALEAGAGAAPELGGTGGTGVPAGGSAGSQAGGTAGGGAPPGGQPTCSAAVALAAAEPPEEFSWDGFASSAGPMCSSSPGGTCQYLEIYSFSDKALSAEVQCRTTELFEGPCGDESSCGTFVGTFRLNASYAAEPAGDGWRLVGGAPHAIQPTTTGQCIFGQQANSTESVVVLWAAATDPFLGRAYPCPR
jgi:hypothetical protein